MIGSADGTPPFFGRLKRAYRDPRGLRARSRRRPRPCARLSRSTCRCRRRRALPGAFRRSARSPMPASTLVFDCRRIVAGERTKMQTWRKYALGAVLGGVVAGAIGWYFDAAQVQVVDRQILGLRRRQLPPRAAAGSAISSPIRSSTNMARSTSARSPAGSGCSGRNWSRASSTGRSPRRCSRSTSCCSSALHRQLAAAVPRPVQRARRRGAARAGGARDALGPLDGADHQHVPAPVARTRPGTIRTARCARSSRPAPTHRHALWRLPQFQPDDLPRPARLRLAARPHLVRSHGAAGRDAGQPVVSSAATAPTRRRGGSSATARAPAPFPTASAASAPGRRC